MSEADLRAVSEMVEKSTHPEDIFGILVGTKAEQTTGLKHQYKRLVDTIHPDKYEGDKTLKSIASAAMLKAAELLHKAEQKIKAGTYGDRTKEARPEIVDPDPPPASVEVNKVKYDLLRVYSQGDLCDLYDCAYTPPAPKKPVKVTPAADKTVWSTLVEPDEDMPPDPTPRANALFKIVRSAADNDLLENEAKVLGKLYPVDQKDEKYFRYLPKLLDSFTYRNRTGARRRVNLITKYDGMYPMSDVLGVYPKGLDYRDVVWMFKRLLVGLGYVHGQGYIHGAVIPPHVLVHSVNHGARIVGWSYAVEQDDKSHVRALSKAYRTFYAPEILAKKPATSETDIFMAAKCFVAMVGGDVATGRMPDSVPAPIQGFIQGCLLASPAARPNDAWKLHDELKDILEKVVGKPKYRPLAMPPAAKA